jgi:pyruvate/2-oxoglutarate/acetoin dehydrogenase E1 component
MRNPGHFQICENCPIPYCKDLEDAVLPQKKDLEEAIRKLYWF